MVLKFGEICVYGKIYIVLHPFGCVHVTLFHPVRSPVLADGAFRPGTGGAALGLADVVVRDFQVVPLLAHTDRRRRKNRPQSAVGDRHEPSVDARHPADVRTAHDVQMGIEKRGAENARFRLGAVDARRHSGRTRLAGQRQTDARTLPAAVVARNVGDRLPGRDAHQDGRDRTVQRRGFLGGQACRRGHPTRS